MTCGLSDGELAILYKLFRKHSFHRNTAFHSKLMKKIYDKGGHDTPINRAVKKLIREGYITETPKQAGLKYYISDRKATLIALGDHGYDVPRGRD